MTSLAPGRLTRDELVARIRADEIDTVVIAITDMQGRLQGKFVDGTYFLDHLHDGVVEGCSYLLASDVDMRTVDGFALTSWERGYGDLAFKPDFSTIRVMTWHEKTAIVFADVESVDGVPVAPSPRQVLLAQVERLGQRGWHGITGTELEFIVFDDSYEQAWDAGYRDMTPANQYNVDYSIQGVSRVEPLLGRIRRSMKRAGMIVESVKGECNFGQHEIAFLYSTLVDKCDEHSLFKLGAKEIAAQESRSLTFMAKYDQREGNSCHIHLSLRDANDAPVFAGTDPTGSPRSSITSSRGCARTPANSRSSWPRTSTATSASSRGPSPRPPCSGASTTAPARFASSVTDRRCAWSAVSPVVT